MWVQDKGEVRTARVCKSVPNIHMYALISRHTHKTCAGTQIRTCFNSSALSTRGLCVHGWEMPCQHAPHESLEGRERLNSIKTSMWWKMHGDERGTVAPCTQLSTKKLLRIFLPSLSCLPYWQCCLPDWLHSPSNENRNLYTVYINTPELHVCKPSRIKTRNNCFKYKIVTFEFNCALANQQCWIQIFTILYNITHRFVETRDETQKSLLK